MNVNKTLYLSVGDNGGIYNGRPDGTKEIFLEYDADQPLRALAGNNDPEAEPATFIVCVVGSYGGIFKSDRVTNNVRNDWTKVFTATNSLTGIAYGNGAWIAVGLNNTLCRSTDGVNWIETRGPVGAANWSWVTYGGGQFVACGGGTVAGQSQGFIMFSNDGGETWSKGNSGTKSFLHSIAYNTENGKFVAVGDNGTVVTVK